MSMESYGGMILTGENAKNSEKTRSSVTLSITNPTWTDQAANPGLRGERPATNRLSHGMPFSLSIRCEIPVSHGGECEDDRFLVLCTVQSC